MTNILVTGGSGILGRTLVPRLVKSGVHVRTLSRHAPAQTTPAVEWQQADLATSAGLTEAVAGVETIIHAASSVQNTQQIDVDGTQRLIEAAGRAGVSHLIYVSIVGIDRIPFGYYRHKLAAENLIKQGRVPWSILRATQFHNLIDMALQAVMRLPILPLPTDFQFQVIDPGEVADRLVESVTAGPAAYLPDIGGPEVLSLGQMLKDWLTVRRQRRLILPLPLPGKVAQGFRRGYNTTPAGRYGRITWAEWLQTHYGQPDHSRDHQSVPT